MAHKAAPFPVSSADLATPSLPGVMSPADKTKANNTWPYASADLTDADQTITPGTSQKSQYVMQAGVQTADRIVTIANADCATLQICDIVKPVADAHSLTVKAAGGATILVIAANTAVRVEAYFTGATWALSIWFYQ